MMIPDDMIPEIWKNVNHNMNHQGHPRYDIEAVKFVG